MYLARKKQLSFIESLLAMKGMWVSHLGIGELKTLVNKERLELSFQKYDVSVADAWETWEDNSPDWKVLEKSGLGLTLSNYLQSVACCQESIMINEIYGIQEQDIIFKGQSKSNQPEALTWLSFPHMQHDLLSNSSSLCFAS